MEVLVWGCGGRGGLASMGISGLLPELSGTMKRCQLSDLSGQTAGVDVSGWLYKCVESPFHYVCRRVDLLYRNGITAVLVFDGDDIDAKSEVKEYRRMERDKVTARAHKLKGSIGKNEEGEKNTKLLDRPVVEKRIKEWCRIHNIKFVQSPCEADVQLAYMAQKKIIDFVLSEDSDLVVFGCDKVLYKFSNDSGEMYQKELLQGTWLDPWDLDSLQAICILVGCDYWKKGVPGIGMQSAKKLYRQLAPDFTFRKLNKLVDQLGKSLDKVAFMRAFSTFKHQLVVDKTEQLVPLTPYPSGKSWLDFPYAGNYDTVKFEIFNPQSKPIHLGVFKRIDVGFHCSLCVELFSSIGDLKSHRSTAHPIKCHVCNRRFTYPGELTDHLKLHEDDPKADKICDQCGKAFVTNKQLFNHREVHKPESYICPKCPRCCKTRKELARHMAVHSEERKFVCKICGEAFKTKQSLKNHESKHSSDRLHLCACGKGFKSKRELEAHEETHSNERNHICETCGRAFKNKKTLWGHQKTHSDEKSHVCPTCNKRFRTKHEVVKHQRAHSDVRAYVCEICRQGCKTKGSLDRHRKRKH